LQALSPAVMTQPKIVVPKRVMHAHVMSETHKMRV
jgi:hypothetical protein